MMGLKGTQGDVTRWNSRVKLAATFAGYTSSSGRTLKGYNGLLGKSQASALVRACTLQRCER